MEVGETLTRFIMEQGRKYPDASGDFTQLMVELTRAGKMIANTVNKAGLANILGLSGTINVHGERVEKLDEWANEVILKAGAGTGRLSAAVSEELEGIYQVPGGQEQGDYILVFDPVDGSSNIDVNVSIGTIFSIFRKESAGLANETDFLRPGCEQVCAGYLIYGSSTMLVYTTGQGVHGFTLDPAIGEFLLSNKSIRFPESSKYYSVNESYRNRWDDGMRSYVDYLKQDDPDSGRPYSGRYIGSLVADFHRNLLKGGIFMYPGDSKSPTGKLRLVYEALPLAFIAEQAGGAASNGRDPISGLRPENLHQTVPLFIGSAPDVSVAEAFLQGRRGG